MGPPYCIAYSVPWTRQFYNPDSGPCFALFVSKSAQMHFVRRAHMAETRSSKQKEESRFADERTSHLAAAARPSDLTVSLSRSFLTALTILRDAAEAELLVFEAIENLEPQDITGDSVRAGVISRLVQAQLAGRSDSPAQPFPDARE